MKKKICGNMFARLSHVCIVNHTERRVVSTEVSGVTTVELSAGYWMVDGGYCI